MDTIVVIAIASMAAIVARAIAMMAIVRMTDDGDGSDDSEEV